MREKSSPEQGRSTKSLAQKADLRKTYKEALLPTPTNRIILVRGVEERITRQTLEKDETEELLQQSTEEGGESHPVLLLLRDILRNLSSKWERALIIRVFEETRNTHITKKRLQSFWKIGMQFHIKEIGKGFFIIHDLAKDERTSIIAGRSWKLGASPITVRWYQIESKNVVTAIWVTIYYLPIEYHSPEILIALGNKIGKTVALDDRNSSIARCVHLCVEINLSKALPAFVEVNSRQYEVIFENTHFFFPILNFQNVFSQKNYVVTNGYPVHHPSVSSIMSDYAKLKLVFPSKKVKPS